MKEMDLREALSWCYENKGKRLRVNGIPSIAQIRMVVRETTQKDELGLADVYLLQGKQSGEWQNLRGWWWHIMQPNVTFSLIEDNEEKLKELENKQRELAKEQEELADEIRRLRQ